MTTATMHSSEEISSGSLGKYTVLAEPRRSGLSDSEYHRYLFLHWSVRSFACGLCLCVLHGNCVLVWQHQEQGVSWLLELLRPGSQKLMLSLWAAPGTNDNSNSLQMKKSFLQESHKIQALRVYVKIGLNSISDIPNIEIACTFVKQPLLPLFLCP